MFGRGTAPKVALESIVPGLARKENIQPEHTRITYLPPVAAIVQLVRDGSRAQLIPTGSRKIFWKAFEFWILCGFSKRQIESPS
jgi:hypothetical protein